MHSEFLNENKGKLNAQIQHNILRDQQAQVEAKTVGEGQLAVDFRGHKFWQLFEKDLLDIKDKLTFNLVNCNGTKAEMQRLQVEIKCIDRFIKTPDKYIQRTRQLIARKTRR